MPWRFKIDLNKKTFLLAPAVKFSLGAGLLFAFNGFTIGPDFRLRTSFQPILGAFGCIVFAITVRFLTRSEGWPHADAHEFPPVVFEGTDCQKDTLQSAKDLIVGSNCQVGSPPFPDATRILNECAEGFGNKHPIQAGFIAAYLVICALFRSPEGRYGYSTLWTVYPWGIWAVHSFLTMKKRGVAISGPV